jgi:hypothetical protein
MFFFSGEMLLLGGDKRKGGLQILKKNFLGFFVQSLLYFENLLEVITFKHAIYGGRQYKVGF